jgi:hypothetical protein
VSTLRDPKRIEPSIPAPSRRDARRLGLAAIALEEVHAYQ